MTSIERTAYPRLFKHKNYRKKELETYVPSLEEIDYIESNLRTAQQKLNFAVQLKVFQKLGYFADPQEIPSPIVRKIREALSVTSQLKVLYTNKTDMYRHRELIKKQMQVNSWDKAAKALAFDKALKIAQTLNDPADIINAVIEEVIKLCYELPAFSTLDRLTKKARSEVNTALFKKLSSNLKKDGLAKMLDEFIAAPPSPNYTSHYQALKHLPKKPTIKNFKRLLVHNEFLEKIGDLSRYLKDIPKLKLDQFIEEAKSLDVSDIRLRLSEEKKYTLVACLADNAQKSAKDALALSLCKMLSKCHKAAEIEFQEVLKIQEEKTHILTNFLLKLTTDYRDHDTNIFLKSLKVQYEAHGGVDKIIEDCEKATAIHSQSHLPLVWRYYKSKKSLVQKFLKVVNLGSSTQDTSLTHALTILTTQHKERGEWLTLENEVDLSFASHKWRKLIYGKTKNILNKKNFEVCVVSSLADELNSGDLFIEGAHYYADYRQELLNWSECSPLLDQYCQEASYANNSKDFVTHLQQLLTEAATKADSNYPKNKFLTIDDKGLPFLKRRSSKPNLQAQILSEEIKKRLPERNLIDVLCLTHKYTGWAQCFSPLSGSDAKLENHEERYIATTFCYGTSMGPNQTSRHLKSQITPHMLSWVHKRHTNLRKLDSALVRIIDYYIEFPLIKSWGPGKRCAVDGTLRSVYDDNLLAESHIRYGAKGGISYHHVADNYIAFFSTFMPCGVWEAVELIEGLLKINQSSNLTLSMETHKPNPYLSLVWLIFLILNLCHEYETGRT